mgnify:CR=1 FL=1
MAAYHELQSVRERRQCWFHQQNFDSNQEWWARDVHVKDVWKIKFKLENKIKSLGFTIDFSLFGSFKDLKSINKNYLQEAEKLNKARTILEKKDYYKNWKPEYKQEVLSRS